VEFSATFGVKDVKKQHKKTLPRKQGPFDRILQLADPVDDRGENQPNATVLELAQKMTLTTFLID
jgi:hypothetical protein